MPPPPGSPSPGDNARMAKKPDNFEWLGVTDEQRRLLNLLDHLGNNGWARNPQSEAALPTILRNFEDSGLTFPEVQQAMRSIGYGDRALHMLSRWESKRTTGRFGR